jgi:hypothetical protein
MNNPWLAAAGGLAIVVAAVALRPEAGPVAHFALPAVHATPPAEVAEFARIRAHLTAVERELLARDVSHLSREQRAARARHLAVLREYREAGVFPHNHDFPGERVPYFVDEHGTHCAMAYLIARSGGDALVARVAAERNNARVHELADEPELLAWLDAAGLSVHEAARIQPMYDYLPPVQRANEPPTGYAVATGISSGLSGAAIALNLTRLPASESPRWRGVFGVVAGMAGVGLGTARLEDGGAVAAMGAVNAGLGVTSTLLGVRTLLAAPPDRAAPPPGVDVPARQVSASIVPFADRDGAGAAVHVHF